MRGVSIKKAVVCCLLLLSVAVTALSGCASTQPRTRLFYSYFDTVCTLYGYGASAEEFERCADATEDILSAYHALLDIYEAHDGVTNLYTVNQTATAGPIAVSEELFDFLVCAKELAHMTDGQTNIAMGAVLSLWHEQREAADLGQPATLPDPDALAEASMHTSIDDLQLDEQARTVYLADPRMSLDVGAIAKGYVAERIADRLYELGVEGYVIDLGGNLRAVGDKAEGTPFTAGIRDPNSASAHVRVVSMIEGSCVTSGAYERYMTVDGVRYHHIIDPDTLYPATYFTSVTVLTEDGALADALSTALFSMTYEEGGALLERLGGVRAVFITSDGEVLTFGQV